MKIIVDTNIVFSAILNSNSSIPKILIHSPSHFQFYSCSFLNLELLKHRNKLKKYTKLSDSEIEELVALVTNNITFINEDLLPHKTIHYAVKLVELIDINDTPFVALTKHLKAKLWTGDKELANGLLLKGFKDVITTSQLIRLLVNSK